MEAIQPKKDRPEYLKKLDDTVAILQQKPHTAKALCKVLTLCKPAVYNRLQDLRARGITLRTKQVREGRTGPTATAYYLKPEATEDSRAA